MADANTIFWTVLTGVVVYSGGKLIEVTIIKAIAEQRTVISRIAERLIYNSNLIHNPSISDKDKLRTAYKEYRELSGLLRSTSSNIPLYWLIAKIPNTRASKINEASRELMALSNGPYTIEHYDAQDTHKAEETIKKDLKLHRFGK